MDDLGDRMKMFEDIPNIKVMPLTPVCVRLDGKAFHGFTRNMNRPFDEKFKACMEDTARHLLEAYNANLAYTQSDEISLIFLQESINMSLVFSGRVQKICSVFASQATIHFNEMVQSLELTGSGPKPSFDCRVWNLPNITEVTNYLVWREQDAVRNSIQMAARAVFSHNKCNNKNCKELQEMLFQEKSINWNDYESRHKRGTYIRCVKTKRKFTADELDKLPPKHNARTNPDLEFDRTDAKILVALPILSKIPIEERVGILFR